MLQYEIEGKIAVITGCSATDTEIEIPEYIEIELIICEYASDKLYFIFIMNCQFGIEVN